MEKLILRYSFLSMMISFIIFFTPLALFSLQMPDGEKETGEEGFTIDGYMLGRYIYKNAADETDQDIYGELRLEVQSSGKAYELHLLSAIKQDIDGNRERRYFYPLEDIGDAYSATTLGYVYEAYIAVNGPVKSVPQIRIGRQTGPGDEAIFFDGIGAEITPLDGLKLTGYGGAATHFFEIESNWASDWLGGLSINFSPFRDTNLNLDYLYLKDKRNIFSSDDSDDHLTSIKIWQQFNPFMKAMVKLRYIDSDARDLSIRAVKTFPEAQLEVTGNYLRQLSTQKELSHELSQYYDVMGESKPYETYDLRIRKLFGERFSIDIGYFERRLVEAQDEGPFNREYKRMILTGEINDLLVEDLTFSVTGELWETDNREFKSAGFDVGYKIKKSKINIGSYYSLYKYDYYIELGEREDVRTYYVRLKMPFGKNLSMDAGLEYEDSIEDYKIMKIGMRYDF